MEMSERPKSSELPAPALLFFTTKRQQFDDRKSALSAERSEYLEEWRGISDHVRVRRGKAISGNRKSRRSKAILNETAIFNSRVLGAGMMAGVCSSSRPWLKLTTPNSDLNENKNVKLWLDEAQRRTYQVFAGSNYYGRRHQSFRDMGDFGQSPLLIDGVDDDVVAGFVSSVGEYYIDVDQRGRVNTMYRDLSMKVHQMVAKWGRNVPREVMADYDRGNYQQTYAVVHVIEPNWRQIKGKLGPLGMPYMNLYYCEGVADSDANAMMQTSGYHERPFSCPRWESENMDAYGDGCGALILAASKSLQALEKRKGQIVDKLALPPVQAPVSMKKKEKIDHSPGAATWYPEAAQGSGQYGPITPLYRIDPSAMPALAEEERSIVNRLDRGYFVDLFLMLSRDDRRQQTAREVVEKHEEKLIALGPVLDNTHSEGLDVEVSRTFNLMARAGVIPPAPKELDGVPLKAEYTSILAVAQRAIGVSQIERASGFLGNLAAGDPQIMDKWDRDQTVDEYTNALGVPAAMIRSDDEVAELRKQRAERDAKEQGMQDMMIGAEGAKVLSQADTSRDSNLLADILGSGVGRV